MLVDDGLIEGGKCYASSLPHDSRVQQVAVRLGALLVQSSVAAGQPRVRQVRAGYGRAAGFTVRNGRAARPVPEPVGSAALLMLQAVDGRRSQPTGRHSQMPASEVLAGAKPPDQGATTAC